MRPAFWRYPRLAGTGVVIVLTLAGAEPQSLRQRQALPLQFGVGIECRLVLPQFEQDQLVGFDDALEHLKLFAAGILPRDLAARLHRLREFGAPAGRCVERNDEPDRHGLSPVPESLSTSIMTHPPAASSAPRNDRFGGRKTHSEHEAQARQGEAPALAVPALT